MKDPVINEYKNINNTKKVRIGIVLIDRTFNLKF